MRPRTPTGPSIPGVFLHGIQSVAREDESCYNTCQKTLAEENQMPTKHSGEEMCKSENQPDSENSCTQTNKVVEGKDDPVGGKAGTRLTEIWERGERLLIRARPFRSVLELSRRLEGGTPSSRGGRHRNPGCPPKPMRSPAQATRPAIRPTAGLDGVSPSTACRSRYAFPHNLLQKSIFHLHKKFPDGKLVLAIRSFR